MADYEIDYAIQEGLFDRIEKVNKLEPGSEEELRGMKSTEIQYKLYLQEAETGAKLADMAERREMDREKIEHAMRLAEQEAEARAEEAAAAAKRDKLKIKLSIGALALSFTTVVLGWVTDHVKIDDIRNGAAERDQNGFAKDAKNFVKDMFSH